MIDRGRIGGGVSNARLKKNTPPKSAGYSQAREETDERFLLASVPRLSHQAQHGGCRICAKHCQREDCIGDRSRSVSGIGVGAAQRVYLQHGRVGTKRPFSSIGCAVSRSVGRSR